jgi:FkbM family methyltransferase
MLTPFQLLKQQFLQGTIAKSDFIAQAHARFHSILFDYSQELANTDIGRIEILPGKVLITSRRDGIVIEVDPADHRTVPIETLNFNEYEPSESEIIRRLSPHIRTMLDIGANIGWYSLLVARINPEARVHSFEPIPTTFNQLLKNRSLNENSPIQCHNFGFSAQPGTFPFYFYPEGSGNASMKNLAARDDAEVILCELQTLDNFATRLDDLSVDFVKCDVEGNELYVVQGGLDFLSKHRPVILMELLRKWSSSFDYHPNDVFKMLAEIGYAAYVVSPSNDLAPISSITDETIETNFFFVHPESKLRPILDL